MSDVVRSSTLATQPIGEASRVVEGVHQLKLPVPFPLKFIASYLVEERDRWTVIDPVFDYPPACETWESEAASRGSEAFVRYMMRHGVDPKRLVRRRGPPGPASCTTRGFPLPRK